VIARGNLRAKVKLGLVRSYQARTVPAVGNAWKVVLTSTVSKIWL
jgi:hypothetical protein